MKQNSHIGIITYIQRFSINDGPGIRTTVFLKGCRMHCKWCHNPEGIRRFPEVYFYWPNCNDCGRCEGICPTGALKKDPRKISIDRSTCISCMECVECCPRGALVAVGKIVTQEQVLKEVGKDILFYKNSGGGMTLSGGEPLTQPEFCLSLLQGAKKMGLHTALDTNGYIHWEILNKILEWVALVLYDIKCMDPIAHKEFTGVSNQLILDNAKKISESGKTKIRVRVPIIPGFNDSYKNMERTAEFARLINAEGVDLLPFHPFTGAKYRLFGLDYPFPIGEGYPEKEVEKLKQIFDAQGLKTTIGG